MVPEPIRLRGQSLVALVLGVVLGLTALAPIASAQEAEATPEPEGLAALGLQEISFTASDAVSSFSGFALLEGWTLLTLVNDSSALASVNVAQLPDDVEVGEFTSVLSESFQGEGGELPDYWADVTFAGGALADTGETSQTALYLTPGRWVVFSTNPASEQPAQNLSVLTQEEALAEGYIEEAVATPVPEEGATPVVEGLDSDDQVTVGDGEFSVSSDPATGSYVWEVINDSAQVADLVVLWTEDEVDDDGAVDLATSFAAGELEGATLVGGVGAVSPGSSAYLNITVEAGTYVIFSSQPDEAGGIQAENGLLLVAPVE